MAVFSACATALGLGEVVQQSALGEPFRATIPVLLNAEDVGSEELAPECFRLVARESQAASETPQIAYGRATLARNAQGVFVIVSSNAAPNEPALSFTVQAGCRLRIRHEYTVLLDPPVIHGTVADASSLAEGLTGTGVDVRSRTGQASRGAVAHAPRRPRSNSTTKAPLGGSAIARPSAKGSAQSTTIPKTPDESKPKLRVSHGSDDRGDASDISRAKSEEEIRRDLEAETLVLQRRVAELSSTLERMETELRNAAAARDNAERAAKPPPPAPWDPTPWVVVLILLVVVLLLARMLRGSRRMPAFARMDVPTVSGDDTVDTELASQPRNDAAMLAHPVSLGAQSPDARLGRFASMATSDEEASFENELLSYAEQRLGYSALEREHPKVVASVIRDWGKPKVIVYLRDLLVSPRKPAAAFSREAVSDLMLLQSLAMEHAGYGPDDSPWQVQLDERRLGRV